LLSTESDENGDFRHRTYRKQLPYIQLQLSLLTEENEANLPNRNSALYLAHVCACITGLQHSALYRFGKLSENDTCTTD